MISIAIYPNCPTPSIPNPTGFFINIRFVDGFTTTIDNIESVEEAKKMVDEFLQGDNALGHIG
jgi:hypothetical protein